MFQQRTFFSDFRLSLGETRLEATEAEAEWLPVACSRPIVLKPSPAGLPKALWHEVMECCGGECEELSRLVKDEEAGSGKTRDPNRPRGDSDL